MPVPLDDDTAAAILADIRAGDQSCRAIARKHGVGADTVRRVAKRNNITDAFDRSKTANATAAKTQDNRARRAELCAGLLDDIAELRRRMWNQVPVSGVGADRRDGDQTARMVKDWHEPGPADWRSLATAIGALTDRHIKLEQIDADQGAGEGASMLDALDRALHEFRDALDEPGTDGDTSG